MASGIVAHMASKRKREGVRVGSVWFVLRAS